ncbi:MAG: MurR/RpiR family transcriptional regulator [Phycisphaerales bacterium]
MKKTPSLTDLVAAAGGELTPTDRRIAEAVLAEPTLLAFGTVSDLADRVGTSRPSVVRFAHKLGFPGYTGLQRLMRTEVSRKLARPSERVRGDEKIDLGAHQTINDAIDSVFDAVEGQRISRLVQPVVDASQVWVLSGETSRAGAIAFYSGLSMIRPNVHLLDDRSAGSELSHAGPGDAAVVFDFFRYRKLVVTAARLLAQSGVKVVAITDGPLSPLIELTDNWCEITVPAIGPFDSSIPVVAIAELMVAKVARELKDKATERIDRIESLWESTEIFFQ